ncbi:MFS transporter [Peribacillus muralis]|uniref:MFS transporter n=1 Tax=Peribacillus muralis TaxID=264697 RepID=UPI001F4D966B|nr:MFS transporter [Peribacillus muralis]MCK1993221.1 MFS transporter [Peribacillus muralis]MCK2013775.1 MFS transporter [Peribacillus muralis]
MTEQNIKLDDAPLSKFHLKITWLTFGAHFTDGYALGIIAMALTLIGPQMELSPMWMGLLGSSALIGLFFGSLILGAVSDRIGRQKIFSFNFVLITVASFLQLFVNDPSQLLILRILIGFGLGGDYAVGTTLLAEFTPRKYRGRLLALLVVLWTVGYVTANFVGQYLADVSPSSWRWMLASTTIPALIVMLLRIGTPESPRWLVSKGRYEEAHNIIKKYLGPNIIFDETIVKTSNSYFALFSKKLRKRTAFSGLFFVCTVVPYFAIYTFLPSVLASMGLKSNFMADFILNMFLLIGAVVGIWTMEKFSRRTMTIGSFVILTISLFLLGVLPENSSILMIVLFSIFTLVMSAISNLTAVYPAELFPTEIRSTGIGFSTAISRMGSAVGTFLLPISMSTFGFTVSILLLTGVLVIGTVAAIFLAPETKNLSLEDSSTPMDTRKNLSLKESSKPMDTTRIL